MPEIFWGLSSTAWTAIGTLTALFLPMLIGFIAWIKKRLKVPGISICYSNTSDFSSTIDLAHYIRIPIHNAAGREEAEAIEVFMESVKAYQGGAFSRLAGFVPMRLTWASTNQVAMSIPAGAFRLIDLGSFTILPSNDPERPFPGFYLGGENFVREHGGLREGLFEITLTISARNMDTKSYVMHLQLRENSHDVPPRFELRAA